MCLYNSLLMHLHLLNLVIFVKFLCVCILSKYNFIHAFFLISCNLYALYNNKMFHNLVFVFDSINFSR